ncbi:oxaloacetate decarboxylase subunit alpha [Aliikangiella marina]|uniref:Oxaloacetate decarboxylase subunit alpha n=1 Tax=Aliikangiella marina TaxID=1712262 RepID=A0A545TID3_9GAMM|nr:sodium-extruding oxaloacetate decarboxylase subunit alpha [Aliikangiella marina]TQV76985.1 oxaloacetate decarboxylase subunit alpha [Aliikangiella marina]
MTKKLGITELVLRDGHQSLFATRMRIEDMLPIAAKLDQIGYRSIETWGGATFDACIRYLGEDPWERLRKLKEVMPNTPHQMLFRAQNILGYRHYADDVVEAFVDRAAANGMDVFRIFDAMNDMRNLETAVKATIKTGKHAQGTMSYTVSPVHTIQMWLDMAQRLQDMGAHSICIKDMAGLLKPYVAEELVTRLKEKIEVPIALHAHATTGLSTTTIAKAVESGVDSVDTSISSMSMTYGHSATESVVSIFEGEARDTGLNLSALEEISAYFREVRKKYAKFEGSLKGVDSRILVSQVPGGMLTNMENQLKEQGAGDKLDEVLKEIPRVRQDLGYIPLVTPTSQIVGTQAVLNVLTGERYKNISKETAGVLKGEYGATAAPVNKDLQERVLDGGQPITCRPADLIEPELEKLTIGLEKIAEKDSISLASNKIDDVLTYALFPQIGIKFLKNRNNPGAFEPAPSIESAIPASRPQTEQTSGGPERYDVAVNGKRYSVTVSPSGSVTSVAPQTETTPQTPVSSGITTVDAPLAGNIFKVLVSPGDVVAEGDVVVILEAMKMETEVRSQVAGKVTQILVKEGDAVSLSDSLISLS